MSVLDEHIAMEQRKLTEARDEDNQRRIAARLSDLQDERSVRLEAVSVNREALRGQISCIREIVNQILNEDTTLAERLRTLFREQGITIASIITALWFIISTLVLALTGDSAPPVVPAGKPGLKDWVNKQLQHLASVLAKLAGKVAGALPGVIGTVVAWLLKTAGSAIGWLPENRWAMIVAVIGLAVAYPK